MISARTLKPLKRNWQYTCSLIAVKTQTCDTPVMLALKCFIRTLDLPFKSPNTVFVDSLLIFIS